MVEPSAKRRRLQFSLRAFLAFTALVALVIGGRLHMARKQQLAIQALTVAGASLRYESQFKGVSPGEVFSPTLMQLFLGQGRPVSLFLTGTSCTDELLTNHVACLTSLDMLYLIDCTNSEVSLSSLSSLSKLRHLFVSGPGVTDNFLREQIPQLKSLQILAFRDAAFTDDGLRHLKALPALTLLAIANCPITDDGLTKHIGSMTTLNTLNLVATQCTPRGLIQLNGLTRLTELSFLKTISPENFRAIEELESLTAVNFTETPLGEAVDYLSDYHGIDVKLDEPSMRYVPFTAAATGISLKDFLDVSLKPLGLRQNAADAAIHLLLEKNHQEYFELLDQLNVDHPGASITIEWPVEALAD